MSWCGWSSAPRSAPDMGFRDRRVTLKSASQIERMAVAGRLVAEVLDAVGEAIRPGVTTAELDALATDMIRAAGATPSFIGVQGHLSAYRHATCISIDDEVVHGIPGGRRIAEGQIVSAMPLLRVHALLVHIVVPPSVDSEADAVEDRSGCGHPAALLSIMWT